MTYNELVSHMITKYEGAKPVATFVNEDADDDIDLFRNRHQTFLVQWDGDKCHIFTYHATAE